MSGREWKRGDVARTRIGDIAFLTDKGWRFRDGSNIEPGITGYQHVNETARPLVVIDPEDREQVQRLLVDLERMSFASHACGSFACLQAALRSLLAPPKPPEPTGLGAVVESDDGSVWVRVHHNGSPWARSAFGEYAAWSELPAGVRVLSKGVDQ